MKRETCGHRWTPWTMSVIYPNTGVRHCGSCSLSVWEPPRPEVRLSVPFQILIALPGVAFYGLLIWGTVMACRWLMS